ncbi:MAG: transcriptional regulator, family [Clostridia bacterium]|jgi:transcriptional regulator with XRE-family HTH domain|nr:transcriptional regulator, family [Clostridia bacterium]
MPTFGQRFKQLRLASNMNQEELANNFNKKHNYNFSKSAISQYENDKRIPEIDALVAFADYFDVSLDYLLGRVDTKDAYLATHKINGDEYEFTLDKKAYPDGLTHEQVIDLLEQLKDMGMDFSKFKK